MTEKTLQQIKRTFAEAVSESSINVTEVAKKFWKKLLDLEVDPKDEIQLNAFIKGVENCYRSRKNTFELTNLCVEILNVILYILAYQNANGKNYDVTSLTRRKSLVSELAKLLEKANNNESVRIFDLLGITLILEEENIELLYQLFNDVIGILCNLDRKLRTDFLSWLENHRKINKFEKLRINLLLKIPFELKEAELPKNTTTTNASLSLYPWGTKDYVVNPKSGSNYQALQCTVQIAPYSNILPGAYYDLHFLTGEMYKNAESENSAGSHKKYKKSREPYCKIFQVEPEHLRAYHGSGPILDTDGFLEPKRFLNRRMNRVSF